MNASQEGISRRRTSRYPAVLPLRFRIEGGPWQPGFSRDVSLGGLFVASELVPEHGTTCELVLGAPSGDVRLTGHVRWRRETNEAGRPRGFGLEVSGLDESAHAALEALVQRCISFLGAGLDASPPVSARHQTLDDVPWGAPPAPIRVRTAPPPPPPPPAPAVAAPAASPGRWIALGILIGTGIGWIAREWLLS